MTDPVDLSPFNPLSLKIGKQKQHHSFRYAPSPPHTHNWTCASPHSASPHSEGPALAQMRLTGKGLITDLENGMH
jgi:hypothetical protein